MSGSKLQRQLIAALASVLMSSVAVGSAVLPSNVSAPAVQVQPYV